MVIINQSSNQNSQPMLVYSNKTTGANINGEAHQVYKQIGPLFNVSQQDSGSLTFNDPSKNIHMEGPAENIYQQVGVMLGATQQQDNSQSAPATASDRSSKGSDEKGGGANLGGAVSGAMAGAAGGPVGMVVGGILGLLGGGGKEEGGKEEGGLGGILKNL